MDGILLDLALLAVGFALLAKGADWLVDGGCELARRWRVSPLVVGLSVVAWGTSAPEVVVSGVAAMNGRPAIAVGNVLGSNVANIGLVLGLGVLLFPLVLRRGLAFRESFWLLAALGALWLVARDLSVGRMDAAILLCIFALYNLHLLLSSRRELESSVKEVGSERPWWDLLLGCVGVAVGAELAVRGAVGLAYAAGMSERVVGLTVIAFGTSLPELAAVIGSALKNKGELGIGNVIGSNVFNVLAVIGVVALVVPFEGEDPALSGALRNALAFDFPVVLGFSLAAIGLPYLAGARGARWKGALLFGGYAIYVYALVR